MKSAFGILLLGLVIISYQNCLPTKDQGGAGNKLAADSGNGQPYGGKLLYSFLEGFTCKNADGNAIPSPFAVIEKIGEVYKLLEYNCQTRNEKLPADAITLDEQGAVIFDYKSFNLATFIDSSPLGRLPDPQHFYVESACRETQESALSRRYGVPTLPSDQLATATVDIIRIRVRSTYYGERVADLSILHDTLLNAPPKPDQDVSRYSFPQINAQIFPAAANYFAPDRRLRLATSRPPNLPPGMRDNYQGVLDVDLPELQISDVKVVCFVFPQQD